MIVPVLCALLSSTPDAGNLAFFERKVRPVLVERCYGCHSEESGKRRGELLLDRRQGWAEGGSRGPAVLPGNPDASLLMQAVRYEDPNLRMPPKAKLSAAEIGILERWIKNGAVDPRNTEKQAGGPRGGTRDHWSFQPLAAATIPGVSDTAWPRTDADRFILSRLEREGLRPAEDADRRTLVRRLYYDLTGLPPSPAAAAAFVDDESPDARERLVDRLLGSPQYGERWGQHWLDAARFAESSGGGRSLMFKNAWRFRDYVIRSFNRDKRYDQLVLEQLAGDLLSHDDPSERNEQLIASGYLALGPTNYELQDKALLRMEVVDEQIDTVGRTFLAMTLGCARCHDHKFDPVPTTDYYALAGIFRSTKSLTPGNVSGYVERTLQTDPAHQAAHDRYRAKRRPLEKQLADARAAHKKTSANGTGANGTGTAAREKLDQLASTIDELKRRLKALEKTAPPPLPKTMSVAEQETTEDWHVLLAGGVRNLGPKVQRGFLTALEETGLEAKPQLAAGHSGRLELARWIIHQDNALAARVIVNRVWHHVFGVGLVRTTDNFGHTGEAPSHPALLDYLARQFLQDGRSIKQLVRRLVLSRTYGLVVDEALSLDPDNRLFSRARRKRIDAEALRDSLLEISGQLDKAAGGLTIRKFSQYDLGYEFDTRRRSVYVPRFRNSIHEVFEVFDAANPNVVTGRRSESTLPTQALFLMNSPLIIESAQEAARVLLAEGLSTDASLRLSYLRTLGRPPSEEERRIFSRHVELAGAEKAEESWADLFHALFASLDFRYLP